MVAGALLAAGSAAAGAAIFAREVGLDPSPGWGQARIALLAGGLLLVLAGTVWVRFGAAASARARRTASSLEQRYPGPIGASKRAASSVRQAVGKYWPAIPLVTFVLAAYVWFVSSGTWLDWDSPTHYHADLARGFARGKLYLPVRPEPHLLVAPNPYQPSPSGAPPGPLDLSYYDGRFYLYWGPVPAILLLPVNAIVPGRVGDLQLSFVFAAGTYGLLCAFLLAAWDRWFKELPQRLLWVSLLVAGFAGPVTFMLNNYQGARVYEAAILGGQLFLLAGFLTAFSAVAGCFSPGRLLCTGGLWALAVGTRLNLVIPVLLGVLLTILWMWMKYRGSRDRIRTVAAIAAPLALVAALLGWYNWARFGSVTQTGQMYQLTGIMDLRLHHDELLNLLYVPQNTYNYLLNPVAIRPDFPYLQVMPATTQTVVEAYEPPELYSGQQITGLLYTMPFAVFTLFLAGGLRASRARHGSQGHPDAEDDERLWRWMVVSLSAACLATLASLFGYFWTAMRYMADFMPLLTLLSSLGFWMGYRKLRTRRTARGLYVVLGTLLAATSIINSTLIAISINNARFAISEWLALWP